MLEEAILTEDERAHLERCAVCRCASEALETVGQAARLLATHTEPRPGEARAIATRVLERLERRRSGAGVAWMGVGLAGAVAAVTLLLLPPQADLERWGHELLGLLEEVEEIVLPRRLSAWEREPIAVALVAESGDRESALDSHLYSLLPEKYQWLWEVLESQGI